jgi:hypothetical protein
MFVVYNAVETNPSAFIEMMTLHDYDLLQESIKAGRQNEAAARRRAEEGPAEVEEVDEELPAPVEEADTRVRLIVRFKDSDRPMSLEKMKFGRVGVFNSICCLS